MKYLLIILAIFFSTYLTAQCPVGSVVFNSQAEVDAFLVNYPTCTELTYGLRVEGVDITNVNAFQNLTKLNGGALFLNNANLASFSGMQNITSINGFAMLDNPKVVDFSGLENLKKIIGELQVEANSSLQDFTGLENLDSITGQAFIYNNPILASLSGLDQIKYIGTSLVLTISPLLTECDVAGICDYLAAPNGNIFISFNAAGCNSQAEVEAACASCLQENIWKGDINNFWDEADNWSTNKVPDICDAVIIENGKTVVIKSGVFAKAYLVDVKNGGNLVVNDGGILKVIVEE